MNNNFFKHLIKSGITAIRAVTANQAVHSETRSENQSLIFPDEFYLTPDHIYIPDSRPSEKGDVPCVNLTEKEAIEQGWAFRKKSKSVRITNYHGRARDVIIPSRIGGKRVNEISRLAFHGRRSSHAEIDRLQIPGCVVKIGKCAFGFSTVREVIFGSRENGLRVIPDYAFRCCENLSRVILPDTLFEIGRQAFCSCNSLEYIALPDSLFKVQTGAFYESGLRGFSMQHPTRLNDGTIFGYTPMCKTHKLIAARNTKDELTVLLVTDHAKIKFPKKSVEFKHNSIYSVCSLDLSECIDFDVSCAIYEHILFKHNIVVRHGQEGHYFGKSASVSYTDGKPYPGLLTPVEQNGDHMTVKFTGGFHFIPSEYVKFGVKSLKIVTDVFFTIQPKAFDDLNLKRLDIDYYFGADGEILSYNCTALREFRWKGKYNKRQFVQYIPPVEVTSFYLHSELLKAFRDTETWFFDSSVIDKIFRKKYIDLPYLLTGTNSKHYELRQRELIPLAIDVLRSTTEQFPNGTKLYSDYLHRHLKYARKVCEKLKPKYPEYEEFLDGFK